jgi:signal peptidase I
VTLMVFAATVGLELVGLVIWLRRRWVLVAVDGESMVPALEPGDRVLVRRALSRVPPGQFVLLGDNHVDSCDSRNFGLVPGDRILGSVRRVLR